MFQILLPTVASRDKKAHRVITMMKRNSGDSSKASNGEKFGESGREKRLCTVVLANILTMKTGNVNLLA